MAEIQNSDDATDHIDQVDAGSGGADGANAVASSILEPEEPTEKLGVGAVIDGKYRVDAILGRGAMGVVVAATHLDLRETVALKFLNLRMGTKGDDFHLRFRREAQLCAKLRSEHVARVIDVGVWQGRSPFMVMEHLVGSDLSQLLKARGPLPLDTALDYIVQVCVGLAEAHKLGVVHRDLKPSNLFLTKRGDGSDLVKILDFGISKWSVEDDIGELTQSGVVLGSPKYMAVEQLFGSSNVDARADVWSIGAIFYAMLTGKSPYDFPTITRLCAELATNNPPPSVRDLRADVPAALDAVLMRCFARDREQRVANVADLAGDLLDAVHSPSAASIRRKISASLGGSPSRDLLGTGSGAIAAHIVSLSSSGSGPIVVPSIPASAPRGESLAPPTAARLRPVVIGALAATVCALGLFLATRSETPASRAAAPEGDVAAAHAPSPAAALPPPAPMAAITPAAPEARADHAAADAGTKSTATAPSAPKVVPFIPARPPTVRAAAPPVAQAPAVTPPTPAVAAPSHADAPRANPLEDRQ